MTLSPNMTSTEAATTTLQSPVSIWDMDPPTECYKLRIVGVLTTLLFIFSTLFNGILLYAFIKHKQLRTSLNIYIIAITVLNLVSTIIELPFIMVSNLYCKWIWKQIGCDVSSWLMFVTGCSSVYIMVAISFERFYIIYKPLAIKSMNKKVNYIVIALSMLGGMIWATLPLVGWSHYTLEGALTSCAVEWRIRSTNTTSFAISIFTLVYLFPLTTILFTNLKLLFMVRSLPNTIKNNRDAQAKKRAQSERYLTIIVIIVIVIFASAWTPYASVSMYSAFVDPDAISPLGGTLPAIFAKSSMLWTPLFYIFLNKTIRNLLFDSSFGFRSELSKSREKSIGTSVGNQSNDISLDSKKDNQQTNQAPQTA